MKPEELLDDKYLLTTSDDSLSTEYIALGYKQLLEVEQSNILKKLNIPHPPKICKVNLRA